MSHFSALLAGIIFGMGLVLAGMTDPDKVLAFLTLNQYWDPSLIFVLGTALIVTFVGYRLVGMRATPLFDEEFHAPLATTIDTRLLAGASIFGVGWGVAGFCPGPALVGLMTFDPRAAVFLIAFTLGVLVYERWFSLPSGLERSKPRTADG